MDRSLDSSKTREVSSDRQTVASDDASEIDLTTDSPVRSRSASRMSGADSVTSGEGGDCDSMAHLSTFFKFDETHATCVKCGTKLKRQEKTVFNLKKHYKTKHGSFEGEFLAAVAGGSKNAGRTHPATCPRSREDR